MQACPNCGHARGDRFCPRCGQNDRDYARSLWRLVADLIKETFEVDGRLPRTLRPMFLRPGQLAVEFSRNRRASYISPIRLYLFASILFFFVFAITAAVQPDEVLEKQQKADGFAAETQKEAQEECAGLDVGKFRRALAPHQRRMMDEIWTREGLDWSPSALKFVLCKIHACTTDRGHPPAQSAASGAAPTASATATNAVPERPDDDAVEVGAISRFFVGAAVVVLHDVRAAVNQLLDKLPLAMFVTLPAYALLLKVFFYRSGRYYTEHLVFAMHLHTFSFLVYTVPALVRQALDGGGLALLLRNAALLWVAAYCYLALRRYYRDGRFLTAIKWLVLGGCYCVLLIPGLLLSVAATLIFL